METCLRLIVNAFAMLVTIVLFIGSRSRSDRSFWDYRQYTLMLAVTIAVLALDAVAWFSDGRDGDAYRFLNRAGNALYFLANPAVPMLYLFYLLEQLRERARRPLLRTLLLALPAAVAGAMGLISAASGWLFRIDGTNVYHRGPLYPLHVAVMLFYVVGSVAFVIVRRQTLDRRSILAFLVFPLFPAAAGVLQAFSFGIAVLWPAVVISLLLVYMNVQQRKLSIDYLSGAYNRRRLDEYLEERVGEARERGIGFAAFLADMDDFKRINDDLGHKIGDRAIIETARIMRSGLRARDFLGRYAGDEFVAVLSRCGQKELDAVVTRVRARLAREGAWTGSCPRVEVSIGAATFDREQDRDGDSFVRRLDKLMYQEKTLKKRARRIAGHQTEPAR